MRTSLAPFSGINFTDLTSCWLNWISSDQTEQNTKYSNCQCRQKPDTCCARCPYQDHKLRSSVFNLINLCKKKFRRIFNLHNPTQEMITQFTLATSFSGMGILAMSTTAPAAYLASLRNLLSELVSRSAPGTDPSSILSNWAFEDLARYNWDRYHLLTDQMFNQGTQTTWSHQAFMSLPDRGTQHKLQMKFSEAQLILLSTELEERHRIKLLSASGTHAAAFLHVSDNMPGCSMSNAEFEIAVRLRLNAPVHTHLPTICSCGEAVDPQGDHLMKCKRGNEWDMRHTAINQCVASITRAARLPVTVETLVSQIAPPTQGFNPPAGRMDLIVTDSDFVTILADVTVTHPNPSNNQTISAAMLSPGYFAAHREQSKRNKYLESARLVGAKFFPLVLETLGTMGPSFKKFLRKIQLEFLRNMTNTDPDTEREISNKLLNLWTTRISCVLQRANSRLILSKLSRIHQAVSRGNPAVSVDFSNMASWFI